MQHPSYNVLAAGFRKTLIVADAFAICISMVVILFFRDFFVNLSSLQIIYDFLVIGLIPILWICFLTTDLKWDLEILFTTWKQYELVLVSSIKTLVGVCAFAYVVKVPISRITLLLIIAISTLCILVTRYFLQRNYLPKFIEASKKTKIMLVSSKQNLEEIKKMSIFMERQRFQLVHREPKDKMDLVDWDKICKELEQDTWAGLVIAHEYLPPPQVFLQITNLQSKKALIVLIHSPNYALIPRFYTLKEDKIITLSKSLSVGRYAFIKRVTDITLSVIGLIVLAPLLFLTAIGVKITSRGPVLYTARRIGKDNQLLLFPKFRSMYVDADKMRSSVLGPTDNFIAGRYKQDQRITRFGRFIRRWSIDELPQLWCVLIGTMSIVGPRPILSEEELNVGAHSLSRFIAKPGLTGLWQVNGRKETLWEDRMEQDILYIETWSFAYDLLLIFRTFGTIISGKGAM